MGLPANLASTLLQQHVNSTLQGQGALAPLQVNQPIQVVTQNTNNVVAQRAPQNQVKFSLLYFILYKCLCVCRVSNMYHMYYHIYTMYHIVCIHPYTYTDTHI